MADLLLLLLGCQFRPGKATTTTVQSQLGQPLARSVKAAYTRDSQAESCDILKCYYDVHLEEEGRETQV